MFAWLTGRPASAAPSPERPAALTLLYSSFCRTSLATLPAWLELVAEVRDAFPEDVVVLRTLNVADPHNARVDLEEGSLAKPAVVFYAPDGKRTAWEGTLDFDEIHHRVSELKQEAK